WDVKGPVTYFVYALAQAIFGRSEFAVRLLDLLISIAGTYGVYALMFRYTSKRAAMIGAPLFFLTVVGQGYNVFGQPDLWVGWCIVFALLAVSETPTVMRVAGASIFVGITVLIKPIYALLIVVPLVPALFGSSDNRRTQLHFLLAAAVGSLLPIVLCVAWYWHRNAASDFFDAYIRANLENSGAGRGSLSQATTSIIEFLRNRRAVLVAVPAICVALALKSNDGTRWRSWMLGVWIALVVGLVVLQDRWFSYHWAPVYVPLAIAAAMGFYRALHTGNANAGRLTRPVFLMLLSVLALGSAIVPLKSIATSARVLAHRESIDEFDSSFTDYPGIMTAADVRNAAIYVAAHTKPTERVLVWDDPKVNVLSERETVSRFAIWAPLLPLRGEVTARHTRNRAEFFQALERQSPALVLVERSAWRNSPQITVHHLPTKFPELADWIDAHYVASDTVGNFLVFRKP
ncbi:MAG: glycosyltransferase family 39 protein, partial [Gemmatimonadaceae bacterium]